MIKRGLVSNISQMYLKNDYKIIGINIIDKYLLNPYFLIAYYYTINYIFNISSSPLIIYRT